MRLLACAFYLALATALLQQASIFMHTYIYIYIHALIHACLIMSACLRGVLALVFGPICLPSCGFRFLRSTASASCISSLKKDRSRELHITLQERCMGRMTRAACCLRYRAKIWLARWDNCNVLNRMLGCK